MKLTSLPDVDKKIHLHDAGRIAFIELRPDCDAENPFSYGDGMLVSLNRNHSNFDLEMFYTRKSDKDCVVLSYYEHGNCLWFVQGEAPAGANCAFDTAQTAGLWIPDRYTLPELERVSKTKTKRRRARALELARNACAVYTAWCNGEVFSYAVRVYPAVFDKDGQLVTDEDEPCYYDTDPLIDESCGGFFAPNHDDPHLLACINQHLEEDAA